MTKDRAYWRAYWIKVAWLRKRDKKLVSAYRDAMDIDNWSIHNRTHAEGIRNYLRYALRLLEWAPTEEIKQSMVRGHGLSKPELRAAIEKLDRYLADLPGNPYEHIDDKFAEMAAERKRQDYKDLAHEHWVRNHESPGKHR